MVAPGKDTYDSAGGAPRREVSRAAANRKAERYLLKLAATTRDRRNAREVSNKQALRR